MYCFLRNHIFCEFYINFNNLRKEYQDISQILIVSKWNEDNTIMDRTKTSTTRVGARVAEGGPCSAARGSLVWRHRTKDLSTSLRTTFAFEAKTRALSTPTKLTSLREMLRSAAMLSSQIHMEAQATRAMTEVIIREALLEPWKHFKNTRS